LKNIGTELWNGAKSVVSTLHTDARDLISGGANFASNTVKGGQETIKALAAKAGDTLGGIASTLSTPIMVIGVALVVVGGIYLATRK
jgi:hypothetical protein